MSRAAELLQRAQAATSLSDFGEDSLHEGLERLIVALDREARLSELGRNACEGAAAKIMRELGVQPTAAVVANLYADFVDAVIVDAADAAPSAGDLRLVVRQTLMKTDADRIGLARDFIELLAQLAASGATNGTVGNWRS
jgi:2-phospho-L-lactate transferase/gluconeogenesis factor (CofD/UPF0052 family)